MNVKMDKLDIYNNSAIILDSKTPKKIISWITILIILSILFIIFSFVPFNIYKPIFGYVDIKDNDTYLVLTLKTSDFPVDKYNKLYIKNKLYDYELISIEDEQLILKVDIDEDIKISNNILKVNILKSRTTLFKIITNNIKKGFGL